MDEVYERTRKVLERKGVNVSNNLIKEIIKNQFLFCRDVMQDTTNPAVYLPKFGNFFLLKKRMDDRFEKGKISQEDYDGYQEYLNKKKLAGINRNKYRENE